MKCLIILNGSLSDGDFLKQLSLNHDYIICADGGYIHSIKNGITPDIAVGDFDSCDKPDGVAILQYPAEKDVTDCEIAIDYAISKGYKNITLTCALGGRADHQLANMMLCISYLDKADIVIDEADTYITSLKPKHSIGEYVGKTFSIIPLSPCRITINGVYYPLNGEYTDIGRTLTISNIVTDENAEIILESGRALLVINK